MEMFYSRLFQKFLVLIGNIFLHIPDYIPFLLFWSGYNFYICPTYFLYFKNSRVLFLMFHRLIQQFTFLGGCKFFYMTDYFRYFFVQSVTYLFYPPIIHLFFQNSRDTSQNKPRLLLKIYYLVGGVIKIAPDYF